MQRGVRGSITPASTVSQYTRTNISLPIALKAEMNTLSGVNWSAVCASAIRQRLSGRPITLDADRYEELLRCEKELVRCRTKLSRIRKELDSDQD